MDPRDRIQLGVVGKPHGVRGSFHLDGCIDAAALVAGVALQIGEREFTVAARKGLDSRPILTLAELDGREAAAELRGLPVTANRGDLTPLAPGEWYADDLVGLPVIGRSGAALGNVKRITNLPSVDVLEVATASGELLQVPMVRDAIVSIDPTTGVVVDDQFLALDQPTQP